MPFWGREKEIAAITAALEKKRNVILTGKYGIGKTTLVKEVAKINGERWRFLFADFSKPPSRVCHDLLAVLRPIRPFRGRTKYPGYKQSRTLIADLATKTERQCVIVLDNIEKLTPQRLDLIRRLAQGESFLFIAIAERFLSEDDLFHLRACLYPSKVVRLRYLSAKQTAGFFRHCAGKHRFRWTESDIHMLTLATKGYPLAIREFVLREIERQK
jgi:energy-coupling factor transporter ATP-binding protein EcfA2